MPVEAKPLFRPDVLRGHLAGFELPPRVAEARKVRGKQRSLSAAALKNLRDEHFRTLEPARRLAAEAQSLERRLSDLVNSAYGLTPDEVALMWSTAPPRMPFTLCES